MQGGRIQNQKAQNCYGPNAKCFSVITCKLKQKFIKQIYKFIAIRFNSYVYIAEVALIFWFNFGIVADLLA